ncbi:MAG: hypothetical protein M3R47_01865 [Chloroflexota bacterium]|nr:hypothetical protein [Chloroflexota bacterium]
MWILVEVQSGIPISVKPFFEKKLAEIEEIKLQKRLNLKNDGTAIFKVNLTSEEKQ